MLCCYDQTTPAIVCHHTATKYERVLNAEYVAYLFPCALFIYARIYMCVCVWQCSCVCVSLGVCALFMSCALAWIPLVGRMAQIEGRGQGASFVSLVTLLHCCQSKHAAGEAGVGRGWRGDGGRWSRASVLVAAVLVAAVFPQLASACWAEVEVDLHSSTATTENPVLCL